MDQTSSTDVCLPTDVPLVLHDTSSSTRGVVNVVPVVDVVNCDTIAVLPESGVAADNLEVASISAAAFGTASKTMEDTVQSFDVAHLANKPVTRGIKRATLALPRGGGWMPPPPSGFSPIFFSWWEFYFELFSNCRGFNLTHFDIKILILAQACKKLQPIYWTYQGGGWIPPPPLSFRSISIDTPRIH